MKDEPSPSPPSAKASPFVLPHTSFTYKIIYWNYRRSSGLWHWARRRFTMPGLCVLGGWIIAGAVGVDIEHTVTYQSFALLFALLAFSIVSSAFFRGKFSAIRSLPRFGTVGQPFFYTVEIKNLTAKPQTGLTLLDELADPRPGYNEWLAFQLEQSRHVRPFRFSHRRNLNPFRLGTVKPARIPPIPARGRVTMTAELLPLRRGVLHFESVTVACPDPLGLFRAFSRFQAAQTVAILPRRYPLPPVSLPGQMKYQQGGVALAANVGCTEEFVSLRDYRHGDPLRHIHWRSWAKIGKPIVREFEDEFFVRHALVLDTFSNDTYSDVLEEAVSVAASFACTVLTQESLLDLLFVGNKSYCFTAGRGLGTADQMLEILASAKNCPDKSFDTLEHLVFSHISMVSGCVCIFQKWDTARRQFIEKLKVIQVPLTVLVIVPPGGRITDADNVFPGGGGSFQVLEAGKIEQGLAKLQ